MTGRDAAGAFRCTIDESAGQRAALEITEKEWAGQVTDLARQLGWWRYHAYRSDRSQPGFPDETLIRDRIVFLELKTEKGKLSEAQRDCLQRLLRAGAEAYVARPHDLEELVRVLNRRHGPFRTPLGEATRAELAMPP